MENVFGESIDDETRRRAYNICKEYLHAPWCDIAFEQFKISVLSGGLMNRLYCCELPDNVAINSVHTPRKVLYRVYGPLQEDKNVIVSEPTIFMLLSERKLGPKLYAVFAGGRLEEYIPSRSLKSIDIKKMSKQIAEEMAKYHALEVPIRKVPSFIEDLLTNYINDIKEKYDRIGEVYPLERFFRDEMHWILQEIKTTDSPVVYCHNDLQGGNILLRNDSDPSSERKLLLIDFEFGAYNYRGFDIGNHFLEWCFDYNSDTFPHFTHDFNKYPTKEEQITYITAYLNQLVKEGVLKSSSIKNETIKILGEVALFGMAANLMWSLWSEQMKPTTDLQFSYKEHGRVRLEFYKHIKERYLKSMQYNGLNS